MSAPTLDKGLLLGVRVKLTAEGRKDYPTYPDKRGYVVREPFFRHNAHIVKVKVDGRGTPQEWASAYWQPITDEEKCFV